MSEMVERVGKAFFAQFQKYGGLTTWDNLSDDARRIWMTELIPIVIEAMREPTEAMVASGIKERLSATEPSGALTSDIWRAMIDGALK